MSTLVVDAIQDSSGLTPFNPVRVSPVSASGTEVAFTGLPDYVQCIVIGFIGLSCSGTDQIHVRIGTDSGVVTSGYTAAGATVTSTPSVASVTTGFRIASASGAHALYGPLVLHNIGDNEWAESLDGWMNNTTLALGGGHVQLADRLTQISIIPSGSDTFDAGSVGLLYF